MNKKRRDISKEVMEEIDAEIQEELVELFTDVLTFLPMNGKNKNLDVGGEIEGYKRLLTEFFEGRKVIRAYNEERMREITNYPFMGGMSDEEKNARWGDLDMYSELGGMP